MAEEKVAKAGGKRIAFIHPDLGIGGAERLVVDAAVGLQELGNEVIIYTSHCDRGHCFEEVSNEVLQVVVHGDFLPTNLLNKLHIFFAILRQLVLVLTLIVKGDIKKYDYFVVDQLSFCIPLVKYFGLERSRVLFYCHFPDQLLAQKGGFLKKCYRVPFDCVEEWSTGLSDKVVVNSKFTRGVFYKTLTSLKNVETGVIYPCVDNSAVVETEEDKKVSQELRICLGDKKFFISINRFERKKNVKLAIEAFARFKLLLKQSRQLDHDLLLVVAGGYDSRVAENVEHLEELQKLAQKLGLDTETSKQGIPQEQIRCDVLFMPSISSSLKKALIKNAELLLYTPSFEHFGIVPVESMLFKTPVLAVNTGGPLESIVDYNDNPQEACGYTQSPNEHDWSLTMYNYYAELDSQTKLRLGENGYKRVHELFTREQMSDALTKNLIDSNNINRDKGLIYKLFSFWKAEVLLVIIGIFIARYAK